MNIRKGRSIRSKFAAAGFGLALLVVASAAFADTPVLASPTFVEYFTGTLGDVANAGGALQIAVPGAAPNKFFAVVSANTNCANSTQYNQTLDTIKIWSSFAQAALLSGKQLRIWYRECVVGSVKTDYIMTLDLVQ